MTEKPWLKVYPKEVPPEIEIPEMRLDEWIIQGMEDEPDMHAFWFGVPGSFSGYYSYKWLNEQVDRFATFLKKELNAKEDDVLAIVLGNSPQFVIAYFAAQRIGVTVTTLNPTYAEAEMVHCLKGSKAKFMVVYDFVWDEQLKKGEVIKGLPVSDPKNVIVTNLVDLAKGLSGFKKLLGKLVGKIPSGKAPGCHKFTDALKMKPDVTPAKYDPKKHIAALLWTGGTTGMPKAAMLSTYNICANAYQSKAWVYKARKKSCLVGVLPTFHVFGATVVMNLSLALKGWACYFPKPPETTATLATLAKLKQENPESQFYYPGAEILFKRIGDLPQEVIDQYDVKGIFDLCISGAGPLHREVQEAFEKKTSARLVEGYGLTEASPVVSSGIFYGDRQIGTIGLPFPNTEWKIVDRETGKDLEGIGEDVVGELAVSGPQVMMGYLPGSSKDAEEQSKKTLVKDKSGKIWLLTGDIGYMREDGRVVIKDRKKELIKYHGYSVFPKEVEELMYQNEAVLEVAVAGIPDPEAGELVKAYVVLKPEYKDKVTEEDLLKWCKDKITKWKQPRLLEFKEELPKTMVGKVMRRLLKEETMQKMQVEKEGN
ncbi:MAG: AMP-binding protein [Promethearchaeota archaeon]